MTATLPARLNRDWLLARVPCLMNHPDPDPCWEWQGGRTPTGYGVVSYRENGVSKTIAAHRLSYTLYVGPIPEGYDIHHECDNPSCVKWLHLRAIEARHHKWISAERRRAAKRAAS